MTPKERGLLGSSVGWRLCRHARDAAASRGFGTEDVLLACVDPQVSYTAYDHGPGRHVHQRGHLAVVVHPDTKTVITVLLRDRDQWTDADARRANWRPTGPAGEDAR